MLKRPMLAKNTTPETCHLPAMASPKLEGVRLIVTPDGLFTRSMKPIPNRIMKEKWEPLRAFCADWKICVEGETYVHGWDFNKISGAYRRGNSIDGGRLELYLFDLYDLNNPDVHFDLRAAMLYMYYHERGMEMKDLYIIPQELVRTQEEVQLKYGQYLEQGLEGLVLKRPDAPYKQGRSTPRDGLFHRIKPELDFDGKVVGFEQRMVNTAESFVNELGYLKKTRYQEDMIPSGMVGVALVQTKEFGVVKVAMTRGLTDEQRVEIWANRASYIGRHLRFVCLPLRGQDKPKAARFDVWRTDLD